MQRIMDFNQSQLSEEDWISNLAKKSGLSILLVDGFGELILLHNICYLQENIFCEESKILGLCGDDRQADVYRIDSKTASSPLEISVLTWQDLKGMKLSTDIDSWSVPDQNPTTFQVQPLDPPLVLITILEAKSLVPAALIPLWLAKFQEFDRLSPSIKACTILYPVLELLWTVHKKIRVAFSSTFCLYW